MKEHFYIYPLLLLFLLLLTQSSISELTNIDDQTELNSSTTTTKTTVEIVTRKILSNNSRSSRTTTKRLTPFKSTAETTTTSTILAPCLEKIGENNEIVGNTKCSYRISRVLENDYLMVKNILNNLIERHWNITLDYFNYYLDTSTLRKCDQYFDYVGISQIIQKDFKHPSHLFKKLENSTINHTIWVQYEAEWFYRYKMINYQLQPSKHLALCNSFGLKLFFLMHDYVEEQTKIFKCSSKANQEEPVTNLVDYYIAQTFIKGCDGNLELLANSIYKIIKYDCERASQFKLAYFNSKYLNLFRTCNPDLTVNDLLSTNKFKNCTNLSILNGMVNRKYCSWFELVCKYPYACLKSMNWVDN